MTAKHRKGKSGQHGHEDNSARHDPAPGREARAGGSGGGGRAGLVALLLVALGGASGAWVCLQQRDSVAQLAEGLAVVRASVATLHEDMRSTNEKLLSIEVLEQRLHALEEAHAQVQRQAGVVATEHLKASDLSAQIVTLQAEMKASLTELRATTTADKQLEDLRRAVWAGQEELKALSQEISGLRASQLEEANSLAGLSGMMATTTIRLEECDKQTEVAKKQLEGQAVELLGIKRSLVRHEVQLDSNAQDITHAKELIEEEKAAVKEQLSLVLQSLKEQSAATQRLQVELQTQMEDIQRQLERGSKPDAVVLEKPVLEEMVALATEEQLEESLKEWETSEAEVGPEDEEEQEEQEIPVAEAQNLEVREVAEPQDKDAEEVSEQELVEQQTEEPKELEQEEITEAQEEQEQENEGRHEEKPLEEKEGEELQGQSAPISGSPQDEQGASDQDGARLKVEGDEEDNNVGDQQWSEEEISHEQQCK